MKVSDFDSHHQPRKIDKKKHHKPGYNDENIQEQRRSRITFNKYLLSLKEQALNDELLDNEE